MDIFNLLSLLGGLALFLYGMNVMGEGLTRAAGGKMEQILEKLTSTPIKGVLLGAAVTAIIQSSSATTVMVVGFVNSGIMKLRQAVGIIMGANIGTTVTSWILSLTGIEGDSIFIRMLKPSSFSPILAVIGIVFLLFTKSEKKHNIGSIFLGFTILMFGMDTMERCGYSACRCTGIHKYSSDVLKSNSWYDSRRAVYSNHSKLVRFGWYFTGALYDRRSNVCNSASYYKWDKISVLA